MKKLLSIVLSFVIAFSCIGVTLVSADAISVTIDDEVQNYEVSPILKDGRTLVPVRAIFESLGAEVSWDADTRTVTGTKGDTAVVLVIDSLDATVNGEKRTLDVPAQIIDSSTFAPARFVSEALNCDVEWLADTKTVAIKTKPTLISTLPQTPAEEAIIKRARMLTDFEWSPVGYIPYRQSSVMKTFSPDETYTGIIYSSCDANDKFVGTNVSFETYLSALANPESVLYNKQLSAFASADSYYGMVCNGLVRYCLGLKLLTNTQNWLSIDGMSVIKEKGEYTLDELKLCDILHAYNDGATHVALITDILRDETGKIVEIEISHSTRPTAVRKRYPAETFLETWWKYRLCRYEYIDDVPPFDEEQYKILYESGIEKELPKIAVNYGNKSNYIEGISSVEGDQTVFSVFAEGENVVEIYKNGKLIEEVKTNGRARFSRRLKEGYYEARLKDTDYFTEFCVCKPHISYTVKDGVITFTDTSDENSKIIGMEFRNFSSWSLLSNSYLTEEESASRTFSRKIPSEQATAFKIIYENKYGIWTHELIEIK